MYLKETIFLGYDNPIDLRLTVAGQPIDHTTITRAKLVLDATHIIDSVGHAALFTFTDPTKLTMRLGTLGAGVIPVGSYTANVIIYTAAQPNGVVWEPSIDINVVLY